MGSFAEEILSKSNNDSEPVTLNDDCLAQIFQFLPYADRVRVDRVCRRWREASENSWNQYARSNTSLEIGTDTGTYPHRSSMLNLQTFEQILTQRGAYLTKISFAESCRDKLISMAGMMEMIIEYCPIIRKIHVENVVIWPSDLKALARCTHIESLGLGCCMEFNMMDLKSIFEANKNMRHLTVSRNKNSIGQCLRYLEPNVLETLHIIECPFFRLGEVSIQPFKYSLRELTYCFTFSHTDPQNLSYVYELKNLRKLKLEGDGLVTDWRVTRVIQQIARNCLKLEHVDLGNQLFMAHDDLIGPLLNLPNLRDFRLVSTTKITSEIFNTKMDQLESLTISCSLFTEKDYENLVNRLPNLKVLKIGECGTRSLSGEREWLRRAREKGINVTVYNCNSLKK